MKPIIIDIHSFVDVITNSSTVIYVQIGDKTIELMKNLIDYFLKQAGSDKTADELFEFKIVKSEDWEEEKIEEIIEEFNCDEETAKKIFQVALERGEYDDDYDESEYGYDRRRLVIISKSNKEELNITDKITEIFDIDGTRDG